MKKKYREKLYGFTADTAVYSRFYPVYGIPVHIIISPWTDGLQRHTQPRIYRRRKLQPYADGQRLYQCHRRDAEIHGNTCAAEAYIFAVCGNCAEYADKGNGRLPHNFLHSLNTRLKSRSCNYVAIFVYR